MEVKPPIEYARSFWMTHFHACLGIVTNLHRLDAQAYTGAFTTRAFTSTNEYLTTNDGDYRTKCFHNLISKIDKEVLINGYGKIKSIMADCEDYIQTWLSYQGLWEIDLQSVYNTLGNDIATWHKVLNDIKLGRKTFDNNETEILFGAIRINYIKVQNKINQKYDAWHKDI